MTTLEPIDVRLATRGYQIEVGSDLLNAAGSKVRAWLDAREFRSQIACVITDENVTPHADRVAQSLAGADFRLVRFTMPSGEASKCYDVLHSIYDALVDAKADRSTVVVAVGGGVVGDCGGFAAASYGRGVPFVQVPTTLLAAVDSSVGGKVGINHPRAKNLIGAFHQPVGVLCDTETLSTLPDREYISGLAEVVKYGVILDADFFVWLEANADAISERDANAVAHIIARSCRLKADVVEEDEFERTGLRAVLNYGHTFAHAFEALTDYGVLLHGEAVSIGMHYASRLAERHGLIDAEATRRQVALMEALKLPVRLSAPQSFTADAIIERMRLDKKAVAGSLRFVLPTRIGEVKTFGDVPETTVRELLAEFDHPA